MLLSWKIFKKSVLIVLDNLKEAFRVSGAIFVAAVFASSALNVFLTGDLTIGAPDIQAVKRYQWARPIGGIKFFISKDYCFNGR